MQGVSKHLVIYDGECGLCSRLVRWLIKHDTHELFLFTPLQGKTAVAILPRLPEDWGRGDTLILIENYLSSKERESARGEAVLRLLWLLGGGWKFFARIGGLLPSGWIDSAYKGIASRRMQICSLTVGAAIKDGERFLP